MPTVDSFNVDHDLEFITQDMIPFDAYLLIALVFVIEKATNKSLPIVTDGASGFVISSSETQAKNNWTYNSGAGPTTVEVRSSLIQIAVKRSQLARAFTCAVCLIIINSALTISSAYVTFLAVVRREAVNDTVLLLPVTLVLVIPALRSLYPGTPPFSCR